MTCSTSFLNNLIVLLLLCSACLLGSCCGLGLTKSQVLSLQTEKGSPQAAFSGDIVWQAQVGGGTPPFTYAFSVRTDKRETVVQRGPENHWRWRPRTPGTYQIRVRIEDAKGHSTTSEWINFRITPALDHNSRVAFFPVENLSGMKAPLVEIGTEYKELLRAAGMQLLSDERLEKFTFRHRVRYSGGIDAELARALREEEGVAGVVITSLESFDGSSSPKIALTSRLVLCHDTPQIVWIDGVGITGDDAPGLLGLKRVRDIEMLQRKALKTLQGSMDSYLAGEQNYASSELKKIKPRDSYLATDFIPGNQYKVAMVPFLNRYARRNAGFVIPLHFVRLLHRYPNLEVVEPGVVRQQLLKYRLIMQAGPSLAVADVLASDSTIGADLILSGYIFDYQDQFGTPKIDFSTRLFSGSRRQIVWWSRSYANGDDGVYFYAFGRYRSTHVMLQEMVQAISDLLFPRENYQPQTAAELSGLSHH